MSIATGPLAGLRVVEMAAIGPVPHCGVVLGDMGAEIVRVDRVGASGLGIGTDPSCDLLARGKRAVPLDLKRPDGVAAALALIADADALIEGFRPGVMERLGLGPEICLARTPRLVYGRISGWGDAGPGAADAGHDLNYLGMTGALAAMGAPGQPPPVPLNLIADFGGGAMQLAAGVLAALLHAQRTGEGQVVATSIFEGAHALTPFLHGLRAAGVWTDGRAANLLDGGAPFYRCYQTGDDRFVAVAAIEAKFYQALLHGLGLPLDPAAQHDRDAWPATAVAFAARFRARSREAWVAHFAGTDACVTAVLGWAEAASHPQAAALGLFEAPGGIVQPRTAPRFSATPAPPLRAPPDSQQTLPAAQAPRRKPSQMDAITALTSAPLRPLPERWRLPRQAEKLAEARAAEAEGAEQYWAWAARHMRWMRPWDTLLEGGLGDFRYFAGGLLNVADNCVDRHAEDPASAERPAVIWEGEPGDVRRLTYRALHEQVCRCANGLRALGVVRGDVVAIYLPNLPEAFVAIHACNRIGAIYTVLFSGFAPDAVRLRLEASRARVVITADASWRRGRAVPLLANLRAARVDVPTLEHSVVFDRTGSAAALQPGETGWAALLASQSPDCPCLPLEANDPAFLIFTSGTESKPKGVVHSTAGFLIGTWANVQWQIGPEPDDVYWCAADVGWLTFPIQAVVGGLAQGMTLFCYEGALDYPERLRVLDTAARHGVTKILIAPTGLRMLRAAGDAVVEARRPPLLRLVTAQGEPLDPDTAAWTERMFDVPVVNAYGQTETGSTWTYPVHGVDATKPGSAGTPVPGHSCAVVDDDGQAVAPGTRGNLVLTAAFPTLARTIWDDPARYRATYFNRFPGAYATSDEAVRDADGQIWVLGRADDVINVAAHRISTMEIEGAAASAAGVAEAAIVGVPDAIRGITPVAFVTLRPDADPAVVSAAVAAAVERAIGGIARLSRVYIAASLPKTRAGKVMRRLLREAAETGHVRGDLTGLEDPGALAAVLDAVQTVKGMA